MNAPRAGSPGAGALAVALSRARSLLAFAPERAGIEAQAILKGRPDQPEALLILGAAMRRSGDPAGARRVLDPLSASLSQAWGVQFEAGAASAAMGDTSSALAALTRATTLNPQSCLAWRALGDQLAIAGDQAGAERAFARQVPGAISDPVLVEAARTLFHGRPDLAEPLLRDRFNMHLNDVVAVRLLADAGLRLGRPEAVETFLAPHVARTPRCLPLRHAYAMALQAQHRFSEALSEVEHLRLQAPQAFEFRCLHAALLVEVGDYAQAAEVYSNLLKDNPAHPKLWLSYGHVLKIIGRQTESVAAYRESLSLAPHSGDVYWSLANLKVVPFEAKAIAAMRELLQQKTLSRDDRAPLCFALAKALEDRGGFEEAFALYTQGNALQRLGTAYDARANHDYVQQVIASFTPSVLSARAGAGDPARDPIFIVGLPRSGSTLVEQMLSSHSAVEGTSELPHLMAIAGRLARQAADGNTPYPASLLALDPSVFAGLGEALLSRAQAHRKLDRPHFIDKFPNNFLHMGLIHLILPNAKIVDVRRHPLACCLSVFKQYFAAGQNYSHDQTDLGLYYADYVALMDHFDAALPGRVHRVHYERLIEAPEAELRRLLDYCGLPFEDACLDFHLSGRPVRTASSEQVRRPLFKQGLDHWRNFEPWLEPLKRALGPVLHDFG